MVKQESEEEIKGIEKPDEELEEILDTEKFKKIAEEIKKESEEEIDEEQFQRFMQSSLGFIETLDFSPSLGQIAIAPEVVSLEQGVASAPISNNQKNDEDDLTKYASQIGPQDNDPKYDSSSASMSTTITRVDFRKVGRTPDPDANQKAFFTQSSELSGIESQNQEKYDSAKWTDTSQAGRKKDIFEREEIKYDPKLPR